MVLGWQLYCRPLNRSRFAGVAVQLPPQQVGAWEREFSTLQFSPWGLAKRLQTER